LTGRPVFPGTRALDIVFSHARETPVPPSKYVAVPSDLEQVVLRCLSKLPDERYRDVTELDQALVACRDANRWNSQRAVEWWDDFGRDAPVETSPVRENAFEVTTIANAPLVAG